MARTCLARASASSLERVAAVLVPLNEMSTCWTAMWSGSAAGSGTGVGVMGPGLTTTGSTGAEPHADRSRRGRPAISAIRHMMSSPSIRSRKGADSFDTLDDVPAVGTVLGVVRRHADL